MPALFVDVVRDLTSALDERSWQVLELRYGLRAEDASPSEAAAAKRRRNRRPSAPAFRTLAEVGDIVGVTRERIRQIEHKSVTTLKLPMRRRMLANAIEAQLKGERVGQFEFPDQALQRVLERYPEEFPHPDRWIGFLSVVYNDISALNLTESVIEEARRWLSEDLNANGGSMSARTFADSLTDRGIQGEDVNRVMAELYESNSGYLWVDGIILKHRHREIARYILREAGVPLHWREIHEKALELPLERELGESAFYNAIGAADDIFVYRGPGTYGLREWGLEPKRFQKDVLVGWFREIGRNVSIDEIELDLRGTEDEINRNSLTFYLSMHKLFYEDLDGDFGLREWLPPPSRQRLDTPRHLRESKRSRDRLKKSIDD